MKNTLLWGLTYFLACVTFVCILLWMFGDSVVAKWGAIFSIGAQVYGIFTMDKGKKS